MAGFHNPLCECCMFSFSLLLFCHKHSGPIWMTHEASSLSLSLYSLSLFLPMRASVNGLLLGLRSYKLGVVWLMWISPLFSFHHRASRQVMMGSIDFLCCPFGLSKHNMRHLTLKIQWPLFFFSFFLLYLLLLWVCVRLTFWVYVKWIYLLYNRSVTVCLVPDIQFFSNPG